MQLSPPPMAQSSQIIPAHSSSAKGKATTKPFAKPLLIGDRITLASDTIGCRSFIRVKSGIAALLSNNFELIMTYLYETSMTIRSRRIGICVSHNAAALQLRSNAADAARLGFRPGAKPQVIQRTKPLVRHMSAPSILHHHSPRQSCRDAPNSQHEMPQGSAAAKFGKLGDRK